jgi:hypothetical protein
MNSLLHSMSPTGLDGELALEIGLASVGVGILGAVSVLVVGRVLGGARRRARKAEHPPSAGSLPPERHQNLFPSPR